MSTLQDPKLPTLELALSDQAMQSKLYQALNPQNGLGSFSAIRHRVLKHKAGKHCVIEYLPEMNGQAAIPPRVIGKLYRDQRGEKMFENLQNLWAAADQAGKTFGMPRLLAYLPELGMVIQEAVPGWPMNSLLNNKNLSSAVRVTARNLAALHRLNVPSLEKRSMADHLKKYCRPGPEVLMETFSEITPLLKKIVNQLLDEERLEPIPVATVHGDLGLEQIFIYEDQAFFIDFDGMCRSHAALDVGNFLVALRVYLGDESQQLSQLFLSTYLEELGAEQVEGLNIYCAFAYLRRAMICFRKSISSLDGVYPERSRRTQDEEKPLHGERSRIMNKKSGDFSSGKFEQMRYLLETSYDYVTKA